MIVKEMPEEERELAPEGIQSAVCVNVFDIGYQSGYQGKPQHKLIMLFELLDARRKDGNRFQLTTEYTATLGEKANLRKDLETWRGKKFTPEELAGFNLDNIKCIACQLLLQPNFSKTNKKYMNIAAILPKANGVELRPLIETSPDYIPDWVKKKIAEQLIIPGSIDDGDFHDDIPGEEEIPF